MKFDNIIIGGGLSGLVCGLRLQKAGKKCAIVSAGQNAMHFFSGGFGLLSKLEDGTPVEEPLKAIEKLSPEHPYVKIGAEKVAKYAGDAKELLTICGLPLVGDASKNGYVISATGTLKPAWLAIGDSTFLKEKDEKIGTKALIVNVEGFLDFNTSLIAAEFEKRGVSCKITAVTTDEIKTLRKNPSEMRSSNISKVMENESVRAKFVAAVNAVVHDEDLVVLPAVFGLKSYASVEDVRRKISAKTIFLGTLPPSVAGIRSQRQLKESFIAAGGTFLMGDEVVSAQLEDGAVKYVKTENLGDEEMVAENFILASGSYFGHGLLSGVNGVTEPVFGLDVDFDADRNNWYDANFFAKQNFMGFGVKTGKNFKAVKDGAEISNLYAIGSVLGGCNALHQGCGAGVALLTAFSVSDTILGR